MNPDSLRIIGTINDELVEKNAARLNV